jgi:hypothetical protein
MKCEVFGLDESFQGIFFGHPFSKACQCANTNEKFAKISTLFQSSLHSQICKKCITSNSNLPPRKLYTLMKKR